MIMNMETLKNELVKTIKAMMKLERSNRRKQSNKIRQQKKGN